MKLAIYNSSFDRWSGKAGRQISESGFPLMTQDLAIVIFTVT
jgi:hypothetical protein